jgi:hypothetical protein
VIDGNGQDQQSRTAKQNTGCSVSHARIITL